MGDELLCGCAAGIWPPLPSRPPRVRSRAEIRPTCAISCCPFPPSCLNPGHRADYNKALPEDRMDETLGSQYAHSMCDPSLVSPRKLLWTMHGVTSTCTLMAMHWADRSHGQEIKKQKPYPLTSLLQVIITHQLQGHSSFCPAFWQPG